LGADHPKPEALDEGFEIVKVRDPTPSRVAEILA
jgi:hypothetical protein